MFFSVKKVPLIATPFIIGGQYKLLNTGAAGTPVVAVGHSEQTRVANWRDSATSPLAESPGLRLFAERAASSGAASVITEQWALSSVAANGLRFTVPPFDGAFGTVDLAPFPNRMPWPTKNRADSGTGTVGLRWVGAAEGDFFRAARLSLPPGISVHYVLGLGAVTESPGAAVPALDPHEIKVFAFGARGWNEVIRDGNGKAIGFAYAEWATSPDVPPPQRLTRLWQLVDTEAFGATDVSGPQTIETGAPAGGGSNFAEWYGNAYASLSQGARPVTFVDGLVFAYDNL